MAKIRPAIGLVDVPTAACNAWVVPCACIGLSVPCNVNRGHVPPLIATTLNTDFSEEPLKDSLEFSRLASFSYHGELIYPQLAVPSACITQVSFVMAATCGVLLI